MIELLGNAFIKVVRDNSDKYALGKVRDFGSRDKTIELRGDENRFIIELDSDEPTV